MRTRDLLLSKGFIIAAIGSGLIGAGLSLLADEAYAKGTAAGEAGMVIKLLNRMLKK